jgi:hypothetical protein
MSRIAMLQKGSNVSSTIYKMGIACAFSESTNSTQTHQTKLKNEHHEKTSTPFSQPATNKETSRFSSY